MYKRQAQETIEANKRFFDGNVDLVPKQAYTMGIRTIMQARKVLMVVNGAGTVSYTHLDVYKRQAPGIIAWQSFVAQAPATSTWCTAS